MWTAIDEAVTLQEVEVYSYKSDGETDPFGGSRLIPQQHALEQASVPHLILGCGDLLSTCA